MNTTLIELNGHLPFIFKSGYHQWKVVLGGGSSARHAVHVAGFGETIGFNNYWNYFTLSLASIQYQIRISSMDGGTEGGLVIV